jgi:diguanylate cyclase (GGDEF)-like protein
MVRNSTADISAFVDGIRAVVETASGVAMLLDRDGQVLCGNDGYRALIRAGAAPDHTSDAFRRTLADAIGTRQPSFHTLAFGPDRRIGFACRRIDGRGTAGPFVLLYESGRQAVASKFATANRGIAQYLQAEERARAAELRLRQEANHWRSLSMTDQLTGLLNAAGFRNQGGALLRHCEACALIYLDLNGFKTINDSLGHDAGDRLLADIACSLKEAIRSSDLVARLGGDEFALMLPGCPEEETEKVIQRIRDAVRRRFPQDRGPDLPTLILQVESAVGCARFPEDGDTLDHLIALADGRMYADKSASRLRRAGG